MHPLKVFKASAGSGKTFTLAVEYIKLVIADPTVYRHILAVTFTNKATAEMKNRIVNQLYGLSEALSSSHPYLAEIKRDTNIQRLKLSDTAIRERARLALSYIIHDYSRFHIETIDSFFQSIIKELARELDLTANLRIDLNDREVLGEAVQNIIAELQDGTDTFKSVIKFVMEKIDEGKNWSITDEIEEFGRNIFNEQYLEKEELIRHKISDKNFLTQYRSRIQAEKTKQEKLLADCGNTFLQLCQRDGLEQADFKQGARGVYGFFIKLSKGELPSVNSYVAKCSPTISPGADHIKEWAKSQQAQASVNHEYLDLLDRTVAAIDTATQVIATTTAISQHINHLMMLDLINTRVRQLNQDANRFLLADTARFLRDMIDGSDIPFIYERTGSRFKHIMIDEFQDTSSLQWENFKPLLHNSLSQSHKCLLVGDVKQSIYRWRNSDWNILNNIEHGDMQSMVDPATVAKLDTNHRSMERVVAFNNEFFTNAAHNVGAKYQEICQRTAPDVEKAYREVVQKVSDRHLGRGYVNVTRLTPQDKNADYTLLTLDQLKHTVDNLIARGVRPNDITILIRYNRLIPTISQYFINNDSDVRIVSEEAFRLSSSAAVNIIMQAMKCIADSDNLIARLTLAYLYQTKVSGKDLHGDVSTLLYPSAETAMANTDIARTDATPIDTHLPEAFVTQMQSFALTPLSQLAEQLYHVFNLQSIPAQDAYMFCFYDNVTAYLQDNTPDLHDFITYWDEKLSDKTIPENSLDGIRIMSIHKSKGLEFHTVIIPFCDWDMNGRADTMLWCEPTLQPYSDLPLTPVNYTKTTQNSIFRTDYEQETLKCFVDNLNLIYVAFTRAESNLFIITGTDPRRRSRGYTIEEVIHTSLPAAPDTGGEDSHTEEHTEQDNNETAGMETYTFGTLETSKPLTDDQRTSTAIEAHFVHHNATTEFRQSNQSKLFITDTDEAEQQERYINEGNIIHRLLELLTSPDDIERVAHLLDTEGCFATPEERRRIINKVRKALDNPRTAEWFSPHWTVYNERSILITGDDGKPATVRPDRVMTDGKQTIVIDYKTGKQSEKHTEQVKQYMNQLSRMGHTTLRGYLWYIGRDEIIEVQP